MEAPLSSMDPIEMKQAQEHPRAMGDTFESSNEKSSKDQSPSYDATQYDGADAEPLARGSPAAHETTEHGHNETAFPEYTRNTRLSKNRIIQQTLLILRTWWREATNCVLAVSMFLGLVILLSRFNGREGPSWPNGLSLNIIVAVVATLCRALTVKTIAEGLSQLKWNSFARVRRPLADLYVFDQASRGALGSLMLLLRVRGRLLGICLIASSILISGLATSSLSQAAISITSPPEQQLKTATAKRLIDPHLYHDSQRMQDIQDVAYSTIMMREPGRRDLLHQQNEPRCPVGDCRWDVFNSLGICAKTENVTERLVMQVLDLDLEEKVALMPGVYTTGHVGEIWRVAVGSGDETNGLLDLKDLLAVFDPTWNRMGPLAFGPVGFDEASLIARFDFIYKLSPHMNLDWGRPGMLPYRGLRVTWHWCVHRYEVSVKAGVPETKLVEDDRLDQRSRANLGFIITSEDGADTFEFETQAVDFSQLAWNYTHTGTLGEALVRRAFEGSSRWEVDPLPNLTSLADDVALAMTAYLRFVEDDGRGKVFGYASVGCLIVVVRWGWLTLLAAQIIGTMIFLMFVMMDTYRTGVEVVKSSNVAELTSLGRGKGVVDGIDESDELAGGMVGRVHGDLTGKLVNEGGGWTLSISHRVDSGEKGIKGRRRFA